MRENRKKPGKKEIITRKIIRSYLNNFIHASFCTTGERCKDYRTRLQL